MIGGTLAGWLGLLVTAAPAFETGLAATVKLYGAGGRGRIEGYASGLLVSPQGHIVTAFSAMLTTDEITAVTADGSRQRASLLAVDPVRELALLKIERAGGEYFPLRAQPAEAGRRVLIFSNAFNVASGTEPVSVQQGVIAGRLLPDATAHPLTYPVLLLDATVNNPGAAGGAVVDAKGNLVGMVGKESRDRHRNIWLHYAVPASALADFVDRSLRGETTATAESPAPRTSAPVPSADARGLRWVANVLERTPAFVDSVEPGSLAEQAGLRPDDLVIHIGSRVVRSVSEAKEAIAQTPLDKPLRLVILRNDRLITVDVAARQRGAPHP